MAPQKGGQATKQQKQQQSAASGIGNGIAKKPGTQSQGAGATALRPAVVPAIPLPMMQRPASTIATANVGNTKSKAAPVSSNGYPVASLEAALIDTQVAAAAGDSAMARRKPKHSKKNEVNTNGTHVEKPGETATTTTTTTNRELSKSKSDKKRHDRQRPSAKGTGGQVVVQSLPATNGTGNITFGDNGDDPATPSPSVSIQASTAPSVVADKHNTVSSPPVKTQHNDAAAQDIPTPDSQSEAAIEPTVAVALAGHDRATNDALFYPALDTTRFRALQQQQRSNGAGIMFGGVPTPDSHTPSPASGAFMPPPPLPPPPGPLLNGVTTNGDSHKPTTTNGWHIHHKHAESNGTNFATPITPFRPGHDHVSSMDSYGSVPAPVLAHRLPPDGYHSNGAHYEPPTPHSFHGSHASGDFNGLDNITPFRPNGHGFDRDHRNGRRHNGPAMQQFLGPQQFPRRSSAEEELLESVIFFQNQFNSAELADCTLELKYPDGFSRPVKINAHKLILARSPALKHFIMRARATDPGSHVITINTTDRYLRSDAWFMAVQRLYLHPLFSPPPTANGAEFAGTNIDQFRFCLGYAAAGHVLELSEIVTRGMQIAAAMIYWHNIEEALGFAFDGAVHRHFVGDDGHDYFDVNFAYGRDTRILMGSITSFLINYFPPNFEFDTTVIDPPMFARIPPLAYAHSASVKSAPAIARGSSTRKPSKGNRLSVIKFGDLPTTFPEEESSGTLPREPAKCSPQLSRILLNLPFEDLRYVMTSAQSSPQAWNTAQDRYHALADVVAEREARRLRAVDAVRARVIPGSKEIQQRLSASRRHDIVDAWDVLNWQEEVVQPSGAGVLSLTRKWTPQFNRTQEIAAEQPYEPSPQESMV